MYGPTCPFLLILIVYGPGVVVVNCWERLCTLGRAPRTKETLSDFHEWCRVTRHPPIFHRLTGCQQNPRFWGVTRITFRLEEFYRLYIHEIVQLHGVPVSVVFNRNPIFTAHFWKSFQKAMGTQLTMSTTFHPQIDGQS